MALYGPVREGLGFHGLWVWLILALVILVSRLNGMGFWVLRCVMDCGFGQLLCLDFWYFIENFYVFEFSSHAVHVVN